MSQFITCEVDGYGLCIPISAVQEINRIHRITPVHRAPGYIRGLLNLRGRVVTMIDLGVRMGMAEETRKRRENVVLKRSADLVQMNHLDALRPDESPEELQGFTVDRVGDVVDIDTQDIYPAPPNIDPGHAKFLQGVARLNDVTYGVLRISRACHPESEA